MIGPCIRILARRPADVPTLPFFAPAPDGSGLVKWTGSVWEPVEDEAGRKLLAGLPAVLPIPEPVEV